MNKTTRYLTQGAIIAALYVVLTFIANALGLANGVIQVRFSEALTILPFFTPAGIPGLTIGCLLSNILTGCSIFDIIFGTLATFIGAVFTYLLRKHKFLAPVPPIVANVLIIPPVLKIAYGAADSLPFLMATVGIGEVISCGVLGMLLLFALNKQRNVIFAQ
ncbi:MAG: QueT transporter family protein [Lachnospiraceae bacterium]|nr:QueT transporter family protein [Lachnospiraceae bacterium]MDY6222417.1 QueT transporter family protein [Candidatus Alectryocaccobium sp.]